MEKTTELKVVLLGMHNVGKTCLVERFASERWRTESPVRLSSLLSLLSLSSLSDFSFILSLSLIISCLSFLSLISSLIPLLFLPLSLILCFSVCFIEMHIYSIHYVATHNRSLICLQKSSTLKWIFNINGHLGTLPLSSIFHSHSPLFSV